MNSLSTLLSQLKSSSRHVIVNGNVGELSELQQYLHVARPTEDKLRNIISSCRGNSTGKLILLCGNVGDGKSHLLSYLGQQKDLGGFELHNDATESFDPSKTNLDTLTQTVLKDFCDKSLDQSTRHLILAINLGVIANLLEIADDSGYSKLRKYIEDAQILEATASHDVDSEHFAHVDFTADPPVIFSNAGATADLFDQLLDRIFLEDNSNPFYSAYEQTIAIEPNNVSCINYEFLLCPAHRKAFSQLLVQAIVKNKLVFSVRELLDFLAEALLQSGGTQPDDLESCVQRYLPFSIFETADSALSNAFTKNDPIRIRNNEADDQMFQLAAVNGWKQRMNIVFDHDLPSWVSQLISRDVDKLPPMAMLCKLQRRLDFFRSGGERQQDDLEYAEFLETLISVSEFLEDQTRHDGLQKFLKMLIRACECWNGDSHLARHIVIKPPTQHSNFRLLRGFELDVNTGVKDCVTLFPNEFTIMLQLNKKVSQRLHVDLELFRMLYKVSHGYLPNRYDQQSCVALSTFVSTLIAANIDSTSVLVDRINAGGAIDYEVTKSGFGITFNRVQR